MNDFYSRNLKSSFPKWFVIFLSFCGTTTILFSAYYIGWVIYSNEFSSKLLTCFILFVLIASILWFFVKILFYSVTATERGLEARNLFEWKRNIDWEEIENIRRPHFGIPKDISYVVSKTGKRLFLIKSMKNYKELVSLIKKKVPDINLL
jgi:hypothetical protein